jgi:hypothetical protein
MSSFEKEKQQSSRQQDLYWIQAGGHLLGCVVAKEECVSGCNLVVSSVCSHRMRTGQLLQQLRCKVI